ncbi:copper chaperone [Clostridiales bacterium COT073_COT-073]|nr:copper chaperone [Clostridiales bacterium COT073_COT-073]
MTKELKIKGMSCGHCVKHVTNALSEVEGVSELQVNLEKANATMQVTDQVSNEALIEAVTEAGYEVVEII